MALLGAILTVVVAFSVLRPLPAQAASADFTAAADRIVSDTNAFRAEHGLAAVTLDLTISDDVAQPWATTMAQTGSFMHNPEVSEQIPSGWSAWGENIAYGFDYADVVAAWIASPEHRANLLGDYNHLGIGYAVDASGTTWLVQDFATYSKASASASAPSGTAGTDNAATSTGSRSAATTQSVKRGAAVASRGRTAVRIRGLKVRDASDTALRISGSTRAHSALRVSIAGPEDARLHTTVHANAAGRFRVLWHGSGRVGTYAITVRYLANKHYAPAYTKWTMTFTRTP